MPNPITTYQAIKFLWTESRPVRDWLWSRLPSARDQKKRESAEEHLAKLLDDANDLARALPSESLDDSLDQRIERFRQDLTTAKIPKDEADILTERATLFVRMLVTGPMADIVTLRKRLADSEEDLAEQRKALEAMERRLKAAEGESVRNSEAIEHLRKQLMASLGVGVVLLVLVLLATILTR